jgi:hypothetical protein
MSRTLTTSYKYIDFLQIGQTEKTSIWSCRNSSHGEELGQVKWNGGWMQYIYAPSGPAIYSAGCLRDIAEFLTNMRKSEQEAR